MSNFSSAVVVVVVVVVAAAAVAVGVVVVVVVVSTCVDAVLVTSSCNLLCSQTFPFGTFCHHGFHPNHRGIEQGRMNRAQISPSFPRCFSMDDTKQATEGLLERLLGLDRGSPGLRLWFSHHLVR